MSTSELKRIRFVKFAGATLLVLVGMFHCATPTDRSASGFPVGQKSNEIAANFVSTLREKRQQKSREAVLARLKLNKKPIDEKDVPALTNTLRAIRTQAKEKVIVQLPGLNNDLRANNSSVLGDIFHEDGGVDVEYDAINNNLTLDEHPINDDSKVKALAELFQSDGGVSIAETVQDESVLGLDSGAEVAKLIEAFESADGFDKDIVSHPDAGPTFAQVAAIQGVANEALAKAAGYENEIKNVVAPSGGAGGKGAGGKDNASNVTVNCCCKDAGTEKKDGKKGGKGGADQDDGGATANGSNDGGVVVPSEALTTATQSAEQFSVLAALGASIIHQQYVDRRSLRPLDGGGYETIEDYCERRMKGFHDELSNDYGWGIALGILGLGGTGLTVAEAAISASDTSLPSPAARYRAAGLWAMGSGLSTLVTSAAVYLITRASGAQQAVYAEDIARIQNDSSQPGFQRQVCAAAMTAYAAGLSNADTSFSSALGGGGSKSTGGGGGSKGGGSSSSH